MGAPPPTLKHRREFLACARARRAVAGSMVVQGRERGDDGPLRVGYTCSKKVGNAVMRNRAKRRLRAAAAATLPACGKAGWDYVLIGRHGSTVARPFEAMLGDLDTALARLHGKRRPS